MKPDYKVFFPTTPCMLIYSIPVANNDGDELIEDEHEIETNSSSVWE